jgi:hypothetical protein
MVMRLALALALASIPFERAFAHPLHMSFTEVRLADAGRTLELSVRVFTDDFSVAAARYSRAALKGDSVIDARSGIAYLRSRIRVGSGKEAPVPLVPCGVTRTADMLRFCFRATLASPGKSVQIANAVLTEMFADQVNVVQSVVGGRRASRMFVRGDGWKKVP